PRNGDTDGYNQFLFHNCSNFFRDLLSAEMFQANPNLIQAGGGTSNDGTPCLKNSFNPPSAGSHFIGNNTKERQTSIKPIIETANAVTVHVERVSRSVNPDKRLTTQNPLSFIHEMLNEPNPIARKIYIG